MSARQVAIQQSLIVRLPFVVPGNADHDGAGAAGPAAAAAGDGHGGDHPRQRTIAIAFHNSFRANPGDVGIMLRRSAAVAAKVMLRQEERLLDDEQDADRVLEMPRIDMDPDNFRHRSATPASNSSDGEEDDGAGDHQDDMIRQQLLQEHAAAVLLHAAPRRWWVKFKTWARQSLTPLLVAVPVVFLAVLVTRVLDSVSFGPPPQRVSDGGPEQHGDTAVGFVVDEVPVDMGRSVVSGLQSMMHVLEDDVLQPYGLLLDCYGTYNFAQDGDTTQQPPPASRHVLDNILHQFYSSVHRVCMYLTGPVFLRTMQASEDWIAEVEPVCRPTIAALSLASHQYGALQEELLGYSRPGEFIRVGDPDLSAAVSNALRAMAADIRRFGENNGAERAPSQAQRNALFVSLMEWYLRVDKRLGDSAEAVDGDPEHEPEYGVLTFNFAMILERLEAIQNLTAEAISCVKDSLLPWGTSRAEALAQAATMLRELEAENEDLQEDRSWIRVVAEMDLYNDIRFMMQDVASTLPRAEAVQQYVAALRGPVKAAIRASKDVVEHLHEASSAGQDMELEGSGDRRMVLTFDPGYVARQLDRLDDKFVLWVRHVIQEQYKREYSGDYAPDDVSGKGEKPRSDRELCCDVTIALQAA